MLDKSFSSQRSSKLIWIIAVLAGLLIVFGSQSLKVRLPFVEFVDRNWLAFKYGKVQLHSKNHVLASPRVSLLKLHYVNRVDFWFDEETKNKLATTLINYEGPVIVNLDPIHLLKDETMKKIFLNPNVIRPIRIEPITDLHKIPNTENYLELEKWVSKSIQNESSSDDLQNGVFFSRLRILPSDLKYFPPKHFWGFLGQGQTQSRMAYDPSVTMHFVYEISLALQSGQYKIPSPILPALAMLSGCEDYLFSEKGGFILKNCNDLSASTSIKLGEVLPLYFYKHGVGRSTLEDLPKDKRVLVVEVVDSASNFSNFLGQPYSQGELYATAVSNIIQGDSPIRTDIMPWIEKIIFVLFAVVILLLGQRTNLMVFLSSFVVIMVLTIGSDFIATFFFNLRTQFVYEFLSLNLFGFVGLGLLSRKEHEERKVIERAFSGYVSAERLEQLLSGREKLTLTGRRRELTTLLLDIEGFSEITRNLEIGNVFKMIQTFFSSIDPIIFRHRGVIDKKMGDGMLVFFGDSDGAVTEEMADAAVCAAVEIQEKLLELDPSFFGILTKLKVRIGINTGVMMVGNTGSENHFNYTVLGEAVNLTQRLEAACPAGGVLVGEETANYLKQVWRFEPVSISIKHQAESVLAYKVLSRI